MMKAEFFLRNLSPVLRIAVLTSRIVQSLITAKAWDGRIIMV